MGYEIAGVLFAFGLLVFLALMVWGHKFEDEHDARPNIMFALTILSWGIAAAIILWEWFLN